jgi:hypothetical protein
MPARPPLPSPALSTAPPLSLPDFVALPLALGVPPLPAVSLASTPVNFSPHANVNAATAAKSAASGEPNTDLKHLGLAFEI